MQRLLMGTFVMALLVASATTADDKKDEKKTETPAKPEAIFAELVEKYRAAKSKDDRQEVLNKYAGKLLAVAGQNAKTKEGPEALFYVMQLPLPASKDSPKAKALAMLMKDHVKNPMLGKQLSRFPASPDDTEALNFLKAVVKENPDKLSQASACKAIVKAQEQLQQIGTRLKDDEEFRERLEKTRGKDGVKKLATLAEKASQEIKEYKGKLEGDLKSVLLDLSVGAKAPEVVSQDLDGKKVKLSDLKGKVVVLDIWATWCGPCRAMIPHTRELVKKMDGKPFVFVSISADAKKETVVKFKSQEENAMPWTHWWNGATGGIVEAWDVEYYPTIYVLDHKGVIRFKDIRGKAMDSAVEKLVKEAESDKKSKSD